MKIGSLIFKAGGLIVCTAWYVHRLTLHNFTIK
jgi:hypothetical protein